MIFEVRERSLIHDDFTTHRECVSSFTNLGFHLNSAHSAPGGHGSGARNHGLSLELVEGTLSFQRDHTWLRSNGSRSE